MIRKLSRALALALLLAPAVVGGPLTRVTLRGGRVLEGELRPRGDSDWELETADKKTITLRGSEILRLDELDGTPPPPIDGAIELASFARPARMGVGEHRHVNVLIERTAGEDPEISGFDEAVREVTGDGRPSPERRWHESPRKKKRPSDEEVEGLLRLLLLPGKWKPDRQLRPGESWELGGEGLAELVQELVLGPVSAASGRGTLEQVSTRKGRTFAQVALQVQGKIAPPQGEPAPFTLVVRIHGSLDEKHDRSVEVVLESAGVKRRSQILVRPFPAERADKPH